MQRSDDEIRAILAGAAQGPYIAKKAHHGPVDIFDANHFDIVTLYDGGDVRDHTAKLFAASWDLADLVLSRGEALAKAEAEIARLRMALGLIADTDPDEGTSWFHDVARAALGGDDA